MSVHFPDQPAPARARNTRVFLTGASGAWGRAALEQLREADLDVVALVLPRAADREVVDQRRWPGLTVVEGDLTDPTVVRRCVAQVDVVLHVGAVVSPLADAEPELARRVNVGSMRNIIEAVAALPDPAAVRVVGVGSVAETGSRNPPVHWGRVGDPLRVSMFDEYGQTKVEAERLLVDSGLPRWTWLRQTGILHPGMLEIRDPIMTHSPFGAVMEWVSDADAARLLVGLCRPDVPEEIWGRIWNIGGGDGWRLTNWELQVVIGAALGVTDIRRWYERNWFATGNFHGQWFTDSDALNDLVPFRRDTFAGALALARSRQPFAVRHAGRVPSWIVKNIVMARLARSPRGTMHAIESDDEAAIRAHFGSREAWEAIGGWDDFEPPTPSRTPTLLDHGYDETTPEQRWSEADLAGAARFRGGALRKMVAAGHRSPATWSCAEGHAFVASPFLVLRGGHWCPTCVRRPDDYARQAERNSFLAQVVAG